MTSQNQSADRVNTTLLTKTTVLVGKEDNAVACANWYVCVFLYSQALPDTSKPCLGFEGSGPVPGSPGGEVVSVI